MRIEIQEYKRLMIEVVGQPWQVYYTARLGAHGQKQYDLECRVVDGDGEPTPEDLARLREHAKGAMGRTKELRKAAKRVPIEFVVSPTN